MYLTPQDLSTETSHTHDKVPTCWHRAYHEALRGAANAWQLPVAVEVDEVRCFQGPTSVLQLWRRPEPHPLHATRS